MSSIEFDCPSCSEFLSVKKQCYGRRVECPRCGNETKVPAPKASSVRRKKKRKNESLTVALVSIALLLGIGFYGLREHAQMKEKAATERVEDATESLMRSIENKVSSLLSSSAKLELRSTVDELEIEATVRNSILAGKEASKGLSSLEEIEVIFNQRVIDWAHSIKGKLN